MDKKAEFKMFAAKHPELVHHIKNGTMSWQKFYEIYDIYGDSTDAWSDYVQSESNATDSNLAGLADKFKNFDMSSIQEHIKTAQKALNLVSELTTKGAENVSTVKGPVTPRPLNKFFED